MRVCCLLEAATAHHHGRCRGGNRANRDWPASADSFARLLPQTIPSGSVEGGETARSRSAARDGGWPAARTGPATAETARHYPLPLNGRENGKAEGATDRD